MGQWWQVLLAQFSQQASVLFFFPKNARNNLEKLSDVIKNDWSRSLAIMGTGSCLALGTSSLCLSAWWLYSSSTVNAAAFSTHSELEIFDSSGDTDNQLVVDISGAVSLPGVYHLAPGSRTGQAITQAGGLEASADAEFIARVLNLAAPVKDGSKIYIPFASNNHQSVVKDQSMENLSIGVGGWPATDLININTAEMSELDSLPGIGAVRAQAIIDSRPYASVEELLEKKVVTQTVFDDIKDSISVY